MAVSCKSFFHVVSPTSGIEMCTSSIWQLFMHLHAKTFQQRLQKTGCSSSHVARNPNGMESTMMHYMQCAKHNEHTFNSSEAPARSNILQLTLLRFTQFFLGWCHMTVQKWKADEVAFKIKKPKLALSPFYWPNFIQATCWLQGRFHPGKLECNKTWCSGLRWINV